MLLVVLAAVLLMPTALALDQEEILQDQSQSPVSYTHLTLPTTSRV